MERQRRRSQRRRVSFRLMEILQSGKPKPLFPRHPSHWKMGTNLPAFQPIASVSAALNPFWATPRTSPRWCRPSWRPIGSACACSCCRDSRRIRIRTNGGGEISMPAVDTRHRKYCFETNCKIPRPSGHAGSSPAPGTFQMGKRGVRDGGGRGRRRGETRGRGRCGDGGKAGRLPGRAGRRTGWRRGAGSGPGGGRWRR